MSSIFEDKLQEARLERAARHVSDYWIPVNPALVTKVQKGLRSGYYDNRIEELLGDIRSDLSLFAGSLGKLAEMIHDRGEELPTPFQPIELLRQAGIEQLKEILKVQDKEGTQHRLTEGSDFQIGRFHEALVSASACEVLGESASLDPEGCYAAALIRQLGVTLIAWNYPAVYQEAVQNLKPGDLLDTVLAQELGFSPSLLAIKMFGHHGISAEALSQIGLDSDIEAEELACLSSIGKTIGGICKIGEALARAHHPKRYPSARDDWSFAKAAIEKQLGSKGIELIQQKIEKNFESYLEISPELFRPGLILDLENHDWNEECEVDEYYNPYLSQCRDKERNALKRLYRALTSDTLSQSNLRYFLVETFPCMKFTGGCIFTVDPAILKFVPQLEFGRMQIRKLCDVDYSISESESDIVAVAYRSIEPVVAYGMNDEGELISMIAGLFGSSQRAGVLYLEVPGLVSDEPIEVTHFRAVQHALNDCLQL